ncbi:MAG: DUF5615 family PIN-like protein [Nitrospirae bacterium]|nr:DUF5615 family PIN-like protein [Nitrospirota bacterium]
MKSKSLRLLADENISPRIVFHLRQKGMDIIDAKEKGWQGSSDKYLMEKAFDDKRFILTNDSDFGTLAINEGIPCFGIIYMRLKDFKISNAVAVLEKFFEINIELKEGALVVLDDARVRIRTIMR